MDEPPAEGAAPVPVSPGPGALAILVGTVTTNPTSPTAEPDFPQRRTLAVVGIAEAVSYLVLLAFSLWHRGFDGPDLAPITGPIHGFLFLGYVALVLVSRQAAGWRPLHTLVLLAASVIPLGGFFVAKQLEIQHPSRDLAGA